MTTGDSEMDKVEMFFLNYFVLTTPLVWAVTITHLFKRIMIFKYLIFRMFG